MRQAVVIAREDLRYALRQKITLLWVFVMPPLFMAFIGVATSSSPVPGGESSTPLTLLASPGEDPIVETLEAHLRERGFETHRRGHDAGASSPATIGPRLRIPGGFGAELIAGRKTPLVLELDRSGPAADLSEYRVRRAVWATLADVLALQLEEGRALSREELRRLREMPRALRIDSHPAGRRVEVPSGYDQAVPGNLVMFTLLVLLTSGATSLLAERRLGLLRRLASAPLRRSEIVVGKWLGRVALGWVQIAFAMAAGHWLFGVEWGPDLSALLLVLGAWGAFCAAAGLLVGSLGQTHGQVLALGLVTTMTLAALGGCWWPIEVAPGWMQSVQKLLPSGWAMDAWHRLVSFQAGAASVTAHLVALVLCTLLLMRWTLPRLRFDPGETGS